MHRQPADSRASQVSKRTGHMSANRESGGMKCPADTVPVDAVKISGTYSRSN